MELDDMIAARLEHEKEGLDQKQHQLDEVFSQLASIIGSADGALTYAGDDAKSLRDAFQAVRNQLVDLLRHHDVELIGEPGDKIDPDRHTVEETRSSTKPGPPRVAEVIGYGALKTTDERILTRARVVATNPETKQEE